MDSIRQERKSQVTSQNKQLKLRLKIVNKRKVQKPKDNLDQEIDFT